MTYIFEEETDDSRAKPMRFKGYQDETYQAAAGEETTANYAIMMYNVRHLAKSLFRRRRMSLESCLSRSTSSLNAVSPDSLHP